ncbi:MAG: hypothetical protein KJ057_11265 [Phycisphaerae bacterium]|nr:MAG: hypothetical protein F9K17_04220 [Phycisphaerae bacterium]MBE7457084.1 hypothetical protein [Planctomycetia bacterium]MCK6463558.1 hypothetical protein [Phycisphaerae bacterium]MCL4719039.1 hypothetical protein [Phycisphaerae bacterium]NUQ07828.1 hypothetical protein [Phycisphaerae bacterium]
MNCQACQQALIAAAAGDPLSPAAKAHAVQCAACLAFSRRQRAILAAFESIRAENEALRAPFIFAPPENERATPRRLSLLPRVASVLAAAAVLALLVVRYEVVEPRSTSGPSRVVASGGDPVAEDSDGVIPEVPSLASPLGYFEALAWADEEATSLAGDAFTADHVVLVGIASPTLSPTLHLDERLLEEDLIWDEDVPDVSEDMSDDDLEFILDDVDFGDVGAAAGRG